MNIHMTGRAGIAGGMKPVKNAYRITNMTAAAGHIPVLPQQGKRSIPVVLKTGMDREYGPGVRPVAVQAFLNRQYLRLTFQTQQQQGHSNKLSGFQTDSFSETGVLSSI